MNAVHPSSKLLLLVTMVAALAALPAMADNIIYTDPANLHVGTGAGTAGATGNGFDPNPIGSGSTFDIYYNTQGNGNLPIGDPFYLIFAIPVYSGSSSANAVSGTTTMYAPYPGGSTSTVNVDTKIFAGTMASGDELYGFLGYGDSQNNSFSFVNMLACDIGSTACPNHSLWGSGAPLAGKTITGFDVYTYLIQTANFGPGDLLNFTGNSMPVGSYVAALGINFMGTDANGNKLYEGWSVPFTQAGLTTQPPPPPRVPEPASLVLFGTGLAALSAAVRRRSK